MQPEHAEFLMQSVYLPGLRNEQTLTRKVIEAIPLDKGDYRPDEVSKTAMELAWHIIATEMRFLHAVTAGAFDFTPMPRPESVTNSQELSQWYSAHIEPQMEALSKLSPEQLTKIIDFRGMFQMPAVMYVGFATNHTVHHRGQLSMYLRPMGSKVPSIYGESYDAAQARKAAQTA